MKLQGVHAAADVERLSSSYLLTVTLNILNADPFLNLLTRFHNLSSRVNKLL